MQQSRHNLLNNRIGLGLKLALGLILNRVRHINSVEFRPAQSSSLGAPRGHELVGGHGKSCNSEGFKLDRVVQTARCAGPSIGESLDNRVGGAKAFQNTGRGRFGVGRFLFAYNCGLAVAVLEQKLNTIEKDAAAGFADIEESDCFAVERAEPGGGCAPPRRIIIQGADKCKRHIYRG